MLNLNSYKNIPALAAYQGLKSEENSFLVDVRTNAEWASVGVPDLNGLDRKVIFVQWQIFPDMEVNSNFIDDVTQAGLTDKDANIYLLCRSGIRSANAAKKLNQAGFKNCFNIQEGFEGEADKNGKRGNINGWKAINLPWIQQ